MVTCGLFPSSAASITRRCEPRDAAGTDFSANTGATGQWSRPQFVTLHWTADGVTYELLANTDVGASVGDLLRIAESIR